MQHHVTGVRVDVVSPTEATATSYFTVMTGAGVDHWGRYKDRFTPDTDGDRWLFAHRLVRTDGRTPGGWADTRLNATLRVRLDGRAAAEHVAVAVDAVDAADRRPVLRVPQAPRPGTPRAHAGTRASSRRR